MAIAKASHLVRSANSAASSGSVKVASRSETTMSSSTPPILPSSASTDTLLGWATSTTFCTMAMFSSKGSLEPSIITAVKPWRMHCTTCEKLVPWSKLRATGTVAFSAAMRASPAMYSIPAYFSAPWLAWIITGERSSSAASTMAWRISMLFRLNAPTA